jgi:putative transposase
VERSITGEHLVEELKTVFTAAGGPPKVLRMDNGPEFISQALQQFCGRRVGMSYIPPGTPWNNGHIESFNNRLRKECLNRNHWNTLLEARVVIGDFKQEHNHRHRHSALGYRTSSSPAWARPLAAFSASPCGAVCTRGCGPANSRRREALPARLVAAEA